MPLYDYRCHRCGEVFEVRQKFSDPLLTRHEACGGEVERLISAPALQFKGTGWYVTDYAKNGKSPSTTAANTKSDSKADTGAAKSESTSESKSESKAESKSDSKPAPAPASTSSEK